MFNVNIIKKVEISNITQAQLEQMIHEKIAEFNSEITVTDLRFIQRRDPTRIEVEVDAQLGPVAEPVKQEVQQELPMTEPAQVTSPLSFESDNDSVLDEIITQSEGSEPESVASMFK